MTSSGTDVVSARSGADFSEVCNRALEASRRARVRHVLALPQHEIGDRSHVPKPVLVYLSPRTGRKWNG